MSSTLDTRDRPSTFVFAQSVKPNDMGILGGMTTMKN